MCDTQGEEFMEIKDERLTVSQAAEILGLSVAAIRKYVQLRRIPSFKVGGGRFLWASTVEAFGRGELQDVFDANKRG